MARQDDTTRRRFLTIAGGAAVAGAVPMLLTIRPTATPATLAAAIRNVVGEAPVRTGKVKLDIPPLVENGNTVPMTVSVASPMTAEDHVRSYPRLQRKEPATQHRQLRFRPARRPRRRCRPASASPTARRSWPSRNVATARSGPASVDVVVTSAACTEEVI